MSLNKQHKKSILSIDKNRVTLLFLCLILSVKSFSKNNVPPNGIKINDSTYIDETELSILDWNEYYFWNLKMFGEEIAKQKCNINEKLYASSDTTKIYGGYIKRMYFIHIKYQTYPMVGISFQQAMEYCKWRTYRVYEIALIKNKILTAPVNTDAAHIFTVEGFLNGTFKCTIKNSSRLKEIPIYQFQLPSLQNFEMAEQDAYAKYLKSKKTSVPFPEEKAKNILMIDVHANYPNKSGIYNLIGNISEFTNMEGVAYGGNWTMNEIPEKYILKYTTPNNALGFRCIAIKTKFTDYQSVYNKTVD